MPAFLPPCRGKNRKEAYAARLPVSQRLRTPLGELKPCNHLVSNDDGGVGSLWKAAPIAPAPAERVGGSARRGGAGEEEAIPQQRIARGGGRYAGADENESFEKNASFTAGERPRFPHVSRDISLGARYVIPVYYDDFSGGKDFSGGSGTGGIFNEAGSGSWMPGDARKVVEKIVDVGEWLPTAVGSESDFEDEDRAIPVVEATSSPEFLRKLKGGVTPARGCFAAGPLVGSEGIGGTIVRDRRKCKPRGVLIVGCGEECVATSPEDSGEESKDGMPKRSVASVEWMVADAGQEGESSIEMYSSAVDMSMSFQASWTSMERSGMEFFCNQEGDGKHCVGVVKSSVMWDADGSSNDLRKKSFRDEAELGGSEMFPGFDLIQDASFAGQEGGGDESELSGVVVGAASRKPEVLEGKDDPFDVLEGFSDTETYAWLQSCMTPTSMGELAARLSMDSDHFGPVRCASPYVRGKAKCSRAKGSTDDLVIGASESIRQGGRSGVVYMASSSCQTSPAQRLKASMSAPCLLALLKQGSDISVGDHHSDYQVESPERVCKYMVPTNSPESKHVRPTSEFCLQKPVFMAGISEEHASSSNCEQRPSATMSVSQEQEAGPSLQVQSVALPASDGLSHSEVRSPELVGSCKAVQPAGPRYGLTHERLHSVVQRKNKICDDKDMVMRRGTVGRDGPAGEIRGTFSGRKLEYPAVEKNVRMAEVLRNHSEVQGPTCPPKLGGTLLGSRIRSISGLLNSQEVRDELRSETNSKLFRKKYPRRQLGADVGRAENNCKTAILSKCKGLPDSMTTSTSAQDFQVLEPISTNGEVLLGRKPLSDGTCKNSNPSKKTSTRYAAYQKDLPDQKNMSADLMLPSRSSKTSSLHPQDVMRSDVENSACLLREQQEKLLRLSIHICHSYKLECGGQSGQVDECHQSKVRSESNEVSWWKMCDFSGVSVQSRIAAVSGTLFVLNAALASYMYSRRLCRLRKPTS